VRKGISSDAYTTIVRVVTCAVTLAAYFTVSLLFKSGYVPSGSMYPTYNLGDICFYSRIFPVENISHEDIVLFCPATKANIDMGYSVSDVFVKRVIGMPGDTIEVADGHLYVNGQVQDRDYTAEPGTAGTFGPVTVPENSFFMMGDNRDWSTDSRAYGFIPYENIIGKVVAHTGNPILSLLGKESA
jgi:signal peptidase I